MAIEEHFNIQVMVQRVVFPERVAPNRRVHAEDDEPRERRVSELLNLKITASDEKEAYAKASKMLLAATPEHLLPSGSAS